VELARCAPPPAGATTGTEGDEAEARQCDLEPPALGEVPSREPQDPAVAGPPAAVEPPSRVAGSLDGRCGAQDRARIA
jgi:hypothetical protein